MKHRGSIGIENEITAADIATADAVILTTDMPIKNVERFDNIKKVKIGVGPAIKQADAIVEKMISMLVGNPRKRTDYLAKIKPYKILP